jgi:hypothetical protein
MREVDRRETNDLPVVVMHRQERPVLLALRKRAWSMAAAGRLVGATAAVLLASVLGSGAVAAAQPPHLSITSPRNGGSTNNQMLVFTGTTDDVFEFPEQPLLPFEDVRLDIHEGATPAGKLLQKNETGSFLDGTWSLQPLSALQPGIYTAVAEQTHVSSGTGESQPVTFSIDITPPVVTLSAPINGSSTGSTSQVVAGSAGTASGDSSTVQVHLFGGTTPATQALETLVVPASNGSWSATFGGLGAGTYTVQAEQRDEAGNVGLSAAATFTVKPPPPVTTTAAPPTASFKWFPAAPAAGEPVSLLSTSTDATSPITTFAWSLASSGPFTAGKPVLTTSFSTAGNHVVRLQVTAANGVSSTATETIPVAASPLPLLLPVPIVRIAGYETSSGVNISVLSVQAPVTARVTVTCRGHGCPTKSVSVLARASKKRSKASSVQIAFRRFERSLPAGVILEIRVSKTGQLGKYTRFAIRRHLLPVRVDACLASWHPRPIACPS